jgi:peptidoglycan lytic transglycosylase G
MKKIIALVVLIVIAVVGWVVGKPYYDLHFSAGDRSQDYVLYIPTGSDVAAVSNIIEEDVMAKDKFLSFAEKLDYTDDKVEPGKYLIGSTLKNKEIIYALKNGNQEINDISITFNNCLSIEDMAGKVAPNIEADSAEIVDYIMDPATIDKYGFKEETMIAMFLPDTYEVGEWDMTAEEFVSFMAEKFKEFWSAEGTGRGSQLAELNLSQSEVSTLASIIESEQGVFQQEWGTIAGLYLNRVKGNWLLQSDPTAKYCWGDELKDVQRLLTVHMKKDCPYNTYLYPGLPPGPIRMPSKKAIDAVLNAESHDYYYMCAKPDNSGLHNFANTLTEHNRNARLFHQWMDSRN